MHMHAFTHSPGSSSSSPGMLLYSYAEGEMSSESNFNSWSSFWCAPQQPSKSRAVATVNPKETHWTTSDVATPSSASSYSIPTPLSALSHFDVADPVAPEEPDFDEFDYDDDDEYDECVDAEDAMMILEEDPNELTHASQPVRQTIKTSTHGDQSEPAVSFTHHPHHHSDTYSSVRIISDRKMTASAPGYPTTSYHSIVDEAFQREQLSHPSQAFPATPHVHPPQHIYSDLGTSSLPIGSPSAMASRHQPFCYSSAITCTNMSHPIPIMQPQPIRPIPPIPLDEFTSSAIENSPKSDSCCGALSSQRPEAFSPLPLLCQPVSDAVRYQLQNSSPSASLDDPECYDDDEDASEGACQGLCLPQEQPMSQSIATYSAEGFMYSRDCRTMAIRWH